MNVQVERPAGCAAMADVDPAQLPRGADPIARKTVPVGAGVTADGCEPK
jgi:hypothetical protein